MAKHSKQKRPEPPSQPDSGHAVNQTVNAPSAAAPDLNRPLRLEWIEAGSLAENPANWRRHSKEQLATIGDLLQDPDVGWAGACLFNERTGRLVDGHARKAVVDPKLPVPVLVGNWSEAAELKILATLDPVASMAAGDRDAYQALLQQVDADSLFVRDLLDATLAGTEEAADETAESDAAMSASLPDMELRPFEHYDYVIVLARNTQDWEALTEALGLERVNSSPIIGKQKVGLCRAVDAGKLLSLIRSNRGAA